MFKSKLEPGDRAVFTGGVDSGRCMKACTLLTVDSHTTVVEFDDGHRMCAYEGELVPLVKLETVRRPAEPWETIGRFQYPLTEDEGSLA
jgi:hypothetical protein